MGSNPAQDAKQIPWGRAATTQEEQNMSYTPESHDLDRPIANISNGIEDYSRAVMERVKSNEYTTAHIKTLADLMNELRLIQIRLITLSGGIL